MIRNLSGITVMALVLVLLLSGCGGNAAEVKSALSPTATEVQKPTEAAAPTQTVTDTTETPGTETPAPNVTSAPTPSEKPPVTKPEVYVIDGAKIYRQSDEGSTLIYDAAEYFGKGWNCQLEHLQVEGGTLYFTEGGMLGDHEEDSVHRIICIKGYGRTVIREDSVTGYTQLVPYGNRIIFVHDGFDSQEIGWANKDGSASAYLDFSDYAAQYGVFPYYNGAAIYMKNGTLYANIAFFTDNDPEIVDHTVSISEDLEITRIS